MRALKALLPQATFFIRDEATKAAMKKLSGPSILHVATHGFFLQDEPSATAVNRSATQAKDETRLAKWVVHVDNPLLRSGLALAGANQSGNGNTDGILTALEAAELGAGRGEALRQVQLQMLSDKAHRHPYYWAGFIQTGEWANLEGKR